jgi:hypothetical protein
MPALLWRIAYSAALLPPIIYYAEERLFFLEQGDIECANG